MLPKSKRLSAKEVREVLRYGRSVSGETLALKYKMGENTKAAVVVSIKVAKRAVVRNRLRRTLYREITSLLPARRLVVVFVKKPEPNLKELSSLCSKLS